MPDQEMIERVAKAIAECEDDPDWGMYCDTAIAAIKAMREPTEKMIDEGGYTPSYHDGMIMDGIAKDCWHTMIDSILND